MPWRRSLSDKEAKTMLLDGKVALVSGTGPNIGREIARPLAANGRAE